MEIKMLPDAFVYSRSFQTTIKDLEALVGKVPMELMENAILEGFVITGPQFWEYTGAAENPESVFQLVICIPVERSSKNNSNHATINKGFKAAKAKITGPWSQIGDAYNKLNKDMIQQNLLPGKRCREVYHTVDFENPEKNETEIYIEIIN